MSNGPTHAGNSTYLVETVLSSVTDIDNLDDLRQQSRVEQVTSTEIRLQLGTSSKNETGDVDSVVGNEMLNGQLGDLSHVVVSLFVTKTRETQGRLSSSSVLLRQIDSEFVNDISGVTSQSTKELQRQGRASEPTVPIP